MADQAQTTGTATTAKAPPPKRTRPSRAKAARTNGAHPANGTGQGEPETGTESRRLASEGQGGDRYTAGREAAADEVRQREEAERVEAERREAAAREAAACEAAETEAARVRQLLANYRALMGAASGQFDHATTALSEISATLTWEPENFAAVDFAIQKAARGLADFRTYLVQAMGLGAEQHLPAPDGGLPECYGKALDALRELRRRLDAQISLVESDVGNVPALLALERAIAEQGMLVTLTNRGLGRMLVREGMAR